MRNGTKWRTTRTRTTTTSTQVIPWSLADGRRQKEANKYRNVGNSYQSNWEKSTEKESGRLKAR